MKQSRHATLALLMLSVLPGLGRGAEEPSLRVRLATPKESYLIGEAVTLDLDVENVSKRDLLCQPVFDQDLEWEAVQVAEADGPFAQWRVSGVGCSFRDAEVMWRGQTWYFRLRVLYSLKGKERTTRQDLYGPVAFGGLAFDKPGRYRIRVDFPPIETGIQQQGPLPSNIVEIHVQEPRGENAEVWRRLDDEDVLRFLQLARYSSEPDAPPIVSDILKEFPRTRYGPSLQQALRNRPCGTNELGVLAYPMNQEWLEREQLLRLPANARELFWTDERLDAEVDTGFGSEAAVGDVLEMLSSRGRLLLHATPHVARMRLPARSGRVDLRTALGKVAAETKAKWKREPRGYLLISPAELRKEALELREEIRRLQEAERRQVNLH